MNSGRKETREKTGEKGNMRALRKKEQNSIRVRGNSKRSFISLGQVISTLSTKDSFCSTQRQYNPFINDQNHFLEWTSMEQTHPIYLAQII